MLSCLFTALAISALSVNAQEIEDPATTPQAEATSESATTSSEGDPEAERLSALVDLCLSDDAQACNMLGDHHKLRYETDKDPEAAREAAVAYDKACGTGDRGGCLRLGLLQAQGWTQVEGHELDQDAAAVDAYRRGCALGSSACCHNLALRLRDGDGVARDLSAAWDLFDEWCGKGDESSCAKQAHMLSKSQVSYTKAGATSKNDAVRGKLAEACRAGGEAQCLLLLTGFDVGSTPWQKIGILGGSIGAVGGSHTGAMFSMDVLSYTLAIRRVGLEARLVEGVGTGRDMVYTTVLPVYAHWYPLIRKRDIDPLNLREHSGAFAYKESGVPATKQARLYLPERMVDVYVGGGIDPDWGSPVFRAGARYVFFPITYGNGTAVPAFADLHAATHNGDVSVHVSVGFEWEMFGFLGQPQPDLDTILLTSGAR